MKPHLRYAGRVWSCVSWRMEEGMYVFRMGFGYDVRSAYHDWLEQEFA
jgi:hypothetical protein